MRRGLMAGALLVAVAACGPSAEEQRQIAEAHAAQTVSQTLARNYPDLYALSPATDCVLEAATEEELVVLVDAGLRGVTGQTSQLVVEIANRPDTRTCLRSRGITL